jgi:hypothetical protein
MISPEHEKKKKEFLDKIINELRATPESYNFRHSAFSTVAKFGLQLKAKQEKLFENEDWSNPKLREELVHRIERFLEKQFK